MAQSALFAGKIRTKFPTKWPTGWSCGSNPPTLFLFVFLIKAIRHPLRVYRGSAHTALAVPTLDWFAPDRPIYQPVASVGVANGAIPLIPFSGRTASTA